MIRASRGRCGLYPVVFVIGVLIICLQLNKFYRAKTQFTIPRKINKRITWFHSFHGGLRNQARRVDMSRCEYSDCLVDFIDNDDDHREKFKKADAVLFQGGRFPLNPPKQSHKNQVYVFVDVESPVHLHSNRNYAKKAWYNAINWTMTYRQDSDIGYPYGAFRKKLSIWEEKRNYSEIFHSKTKDALWMVSDCTTEGLREKYVNILRKYIDVDIYGQCGKTAACSKEHGNDCLKEISQSYKFYLSFENSMCTDYVTEKVFTWFPFDIINVVRGAVDYNNILPNNTYINTATFKTIKRLATFLNNLGSNEEAYTTMLKLKNKYEVVGGMHQAQTAYCDLCKRLHNPDKYHNTYHCIEDWWAKGKCKKAIKDLV